MRSMPIEVLGDRYQLGDAIGRGGMATIYRGQDLRMDRVVAIKVLREVYSTDPKFVMRFQREAKAASALQHHNIVQVYDYGQTDGNYFIVMELVEGTDLRRYLRSRGVLAVERAIIIAHDIALGLGAAHRRGIVHRDVKPQNVLVGRDGSIKLTDFGIASVYKAINAERLPTTGMTLGTVQYYAPEQAQGEIVSPAADVYALGIVIYEMLAGRTPFDGDTPVAVAMQHIQDLPTPPTYYNPEIPVALEEIIMRCLEKEPERRYRDGSMLARALELQGETEVDDALPGVLMPGLAQTPTIDVQQIADPDLRGKTYQAALSAATKTGFTLKVTNGITTAVVINQDPAPPLLAPKGSSIRVTFGSATQTAIVPPNLVGNTLSGAEQILTNAGLRYSIRPDGTDPNNNTPNIVSKVDPPSGTTIPIDRTVILYVQNFTNGTPAASPTQNPRPTNTPVPRPTPTNTPVPRPTPTNTPVPRPTPTNTPPIPTIT